MPRRAFRIAYDGTAFRGFQRQPDVRTVEGALFDALAALDVAAGTPDGYSAAGRTDAGVSAVAQTIGLDVPPWLTPAALDAELPGPVRAWAHADAPPTFHATRDAVSRTYVYHLAAPAADPARADRAAARLAGEHDFHNLTPADRRTVRTLSIDVRVDGTYLVVSMQAPGFVRQLVRRAVALIDAVATGERELTDVDRLLGAASIDGPAGVGPAPPEPLVLVDVTYPSLAFTTDERALAAARERFESERVARQTGARVARTVRDGLSGPP